VKEKRTSIVIEVVSRVMIPFIQLFALYVIIHGSGGPGGGFQGGVIFGASFILYVVVYHWEGGRKRLPEGANTIFSSLGSIPVSSDPMIRATGFVKSGE